MSKHIGKLSQTSSQPFRALLTLFSARIGSELTKIVASVTGWKNPILKSPSNLATSSQSAGMNSLALVSQRAWMQPSFDCALSAQSSVTRKLCRSSHHKMMLCLVLLDGGKVEGGANEAQVHTESERLGTKNEMLTVVSAGIFALLLKQGLLI
jgi:hypothetical protein